VSDQSNADAIKESDNSGDSTPGYDTNEDESFYIQHLFATTDTGTHGDGTEYDDIDSPLKSDRRNPTQKERITNGGEERELSNLDEDEQKGLKRLAETFENLRSHISTAWNNAMVWVDDELVFTELNTLMTVARDAADKVIEATSRAEKNNREGKSIDSGKQLQVHRQRQISKDPLNNQKRIGPGNRR
jgi:hypothetical protein